MTVEGRNPGEQVREARTLADMLVNQCPRSRDGDYCTAASCVCCPPARALRALAALVEQQQAQDDDLAEALIATQNDCEDALKLAEGLEAQLQEQRESYETDTRADGKRIRELEAQLRGRGAESERLRERLGCAIEELERRHPLNADPLTASIIRDGRAALSVVGPPGGRP